MLFLILLFFLVRIVCVLLILLVEDEVRELVHCADPLEFDIIDKRFIHSLADVVINNFIEGFAAVSELYPFGSFPS
jgi:hypothetical protein